VAAKSPIVTYVKSVNGERNIPVTKKQYLFVRAFMYIGHPTYLDAFKSMLAAGCTPKSALKNRHRMIKTLQNKGVLRDLLNDYRKKQKINAGIDAILDGGPDHRKFDWACEYIAKVCGDYAPEKHEVGHLSQEERDARYAEILEIVKAKNAETYLPAPESEETPSEDLLGVSEETKPEEV
jgi:hypothetical protein